MNWRRIFGDALVLVFGTALAVRLPGFVHGAVPANVQLSPTWLFWVQAILVQALVFLILLQLARVRSIRPVGQPVALFVLAALVTVLRTYP